MSVVSLQQAKNGILKYIETDVLPHMSGMGKLGMGMYIGLASGNVENIIMKYKDHPAVKILDVIDDEENVDVDRMYAAAEPMFANGQKVPIMIKIPLLGELGELKLDKSDLDKIYRLMKG